MRKGWKGMLAVALSACMLMGTAVPAMAQEADLTSADYVCDSVQATDAVTTATSGRGDWVKSSNGKWWFKTSDGSYLAGGMYTINGQTYAFDQSGWMITGWYKEGGYWYYFGSSGAMVHGWLKVKGVWYYFGPSSGAMYFDGIYTINGQSYAFKSSGAMITGWYWNGSVWRYFLSSGQMATGWQQINGKWYYLQKNNGAMYSNGVWMINNALYAFDGSGAMLEGPGWKSMIYTYSDGSQGKLWFYLNENGSCITGWKKVNNIWYYMDPGAGYMYFGDVYDINGQKYVFTDSGAMLEGPGWNSTSYLQSDGTRRAFWFYLNSGGSCCTGWKVIDGNTYYLNPEAGFRYENGYYIIDGKTYKFDINGVCQGSVS